MFSMNLSGFDQVQRQLQEAMSAIQELDGGIATLEIDPNDPGAESKAVAEMRAAVDAKVAPYRGNGLVDALAETSKEAFAEALRQRIAQARARG